jgi:hypothetical protein
MPVLTFFAVVGSVLFALLFVADATLENSSPAIVTSQRTGLPAPRYHTAIKTLTTPSAPAPDMTSQAVLTAQPQSAPDALAKIEAGARETRAEALPEKVVSAKKTRAEAPPQNRPVSTPMRAICSRCCAHAAIGHTTVVPLRSLMNSSHTGLKAQDEPSYR